MFWVMLLNQTTKININFLLFLSGEHCAPLIIFSINMETTETIELQKLLSTFNNKPSSERAIDIFGRQSTENPTKSNNINYGRYCQWTTSDEKKFIPAGYSIKTLSPGFYTIDYEANVGVYFQLITSKVESLICFPNSNTEKVISEVQKFWTREDKYNDYGLAFKRGILLWGPAGSGKSCTIHLVVDDIIKRNGIAILFSIPAWFMDGYRSLRTIQPDIPVVVIMEDIDAILEKYHESDVLNILDGLEDINKTIFIATTNYPEKLGQRIVNRPSRFDKRFKIGHLDKEARYIYFKHLIGEREIEYLIDLDQWVADTENMSLAHLKELFQSVVIFGDNYNEAIEALRSMREPIDNRDNYNMFGFNFDKG